MYISTDALSVKSLADIPFLEIPNFTSVFLRPLNVIFGCLRWTMVLWQWHASEPILVLTVSSGCFPSHCASDKYVHTNVYFDNFTGTVPKNTTWASCQCLIIKVSHTHLRFTFTFSFTFCILLGLRLGFFFFTFTLLLFL